MNALAGVLYVLGFIPYIRVIVRKEIKPSIASWIIWASLDTITIAGMYAKDAVNGQIIGACLGAWMVVVLTLKYGHPGWKRMDTFYISGAALSIVLWQIFKSPVLGIITSTSVVVLGLIPTFVSTWKNPKREDKLSWTIFWVSCVFAVLAIPQWTLADASQPIGFLVTETTMMYLLYARKRKTR